MKKFVGVAIVFLLLPVMSYGQLVTIQIEATVNYLDDYDNLLQGKVSLGSTITGTYTYDTSTLDSDPFSQFAEYLHLSPSCGVIVSTGELIFETNRSNVDFGIGITNNSQGDWYSFVSHNNVPLMNFLNVDSISMTACDYEATAITSTTLPATAPILSDWDYVKLYISGGTGGTAPCYEKTFAIKANVTSAVLVPEPVSIMLLGFGLLALRKQK
jgi:hypothetical protein